MAGWRYLGSRRSVNHACHVLGATREVGRKMGCRGKLSEPLHGNGRRLVGELAEGRKEEHSLSCLTTIQEPCLGQHVPPLSHKRPCRQGT